MNCREFLAEFEERAGLSQTATLHLNDCPGCQKTSSEQNRVWQMIDAMKRIDAPTDFNFHVKAKIANGKPTALQPRFLPALRYVLPAALVVLILGLVVFNTAYLSNNNGVPMAAETVIQKPDVAEIITNNFSPTEQAAAVNNQMPTADEEIKAENPSRNLSLPRDMPEVKFVAVKSEKRTSIKSPRTNSKDDFQGTKVSASTYKEPKTPQGISPNKNVEPLSNINGANQIIDEEILTFIGIETISEAGGRKVKSVKSASLAERSGVKVGDVIEAIDGKRVGGEPIRMQKFESKKLTIVRGAEKIELVLKN